MNQKSSPISGTPLCSIKTIVMAAAFAGISGCAGPSVNASEEPEANNNREEVAIVFKNGCPISVVPLVVDLNAGVNPPTRVEWRAYDETGTPMPAQDFSIWYDPFVGTPIKPGGNGVATSPPVAKSAKEGFNYKYTVYADSCPDQPLDPFFRVIK
ncbi:hypothetical protein EY643_16580 [Halioglobus maricola]|uniref:Lipoprotein n=1 Tax=Halioglobus maricola TaxID=2601894 RepID=A0A5P9NMU2_9GAMM|nr:hypothetical protein [Halioglobus maricola]QFU77141.1 hypothetical protein EY643_16580 [Halioglobus maricola]